MLDQTLLFPKQAGAVNVAPIDAQGHPAQNSFQIARAYTFWFAWDATHPSGDAYQPQPLSQTAPAVVPFGNSLRRDAAQIAYHAELICKHGAPDPNPAPAPPGSHCGCLEDLNVA